MNAEERRQAQDENTSPKILAELANSEDKEIRRYVAGNPNTPVEILEKLSEEFPDIIVENPIFDLLLLENLKSKFILLSLARSSTTSVEKLNELAEYKDRDIREAVVKNSKTPAYILDNIFRKNIHTLLPRIFLENQNTGDITLARIAMKFRAINKSDYRSILEHPNASEITINIIKLQDKCQNIPSHFLEKFANDEDRNIRCLISRYPSVSAEILEKMSLDDDIWIGKDVAAHPNTSIKTIEKLARDENRYIREEIARNIKTPIEVINNLVEDDEPEVRGAVAVRKDISEENAIILAHDVSVEVIEKLFTNSNVPAEITKLLDKYHEYDRFHTNKKYSTFHKFGSLSKYFSELSEIIIPEEIAIKIAQKNNSRVQRLLATNQNIFISTFSKLRENLNFNICLGFIHNINTPSEILEELAKNIENNLIRQGVAEHPKVTVEVLDKLKSDRNISVREQVAQSPNISPKIIEELANDSISLVRRAIAANSKTPATILSKLKKDSSLTVRRAVAENPNSAIDTLKKLLNDEVPKIVESAKENLNRKQMKL